MTDDRDPHGDAPTAFYDAEGHDDHGVYIEHDTPDIVEWYEARPVTVSTAAATGSLFGAFALGVLATLVVVALVRHDD